ncbi:MAG: hypothetical protein FWC32_13095 [Firmicutes bacterium]|nr:hypothetical protein [Bacillota bacterium]
MLTMIPVKYKHLIDGRLVYRCVLQTNGIVDAEKDVSADELVQQLKDAPTEITDVKLNDLNEIVYKDGSLIPCCGH